MAQTQRPKKYIKMPKEFQCFLGSSGCDGLDAGVEGPREGSKFKKANKLIVFSYFGTNISRKLNVFACFWGGHGPQIFP